MGKIILRIVFILSLSFNIAFLAHLFFTAKKNETVNRCELMMESMEVSADQVEKIRSASAQIDVENRDLSSKVADFQQQLVNALQAAQVDNAEVSRIIKEISALQQALQENIVKKILICKQHLSPHQCSCFIDNMSKKMNITPQCRERKDNGLCQPQKHDPQEKHK